MLFDNLELRAFRQSFKSLSHLQFSLKNNIWSNLTKGLKEDHMKVYLVKGLLFFKPRFDDSCPARR